jgi:hypothetical protein
MRCGQVDGYERKVVLFSDQILVAKTLPREYLLLEHLVKLKGTLKRPKGDSSGPHQLVSACGSRRTEPTVSLRIAALGNKST